ncbi:MAG: hypothetical protein ABI536_05390 [Gallionella sp.]
MLVLLGDIVIETVGKKEYEKGLEFYYRWDFAGAAEWFQQAARNAILRHN